MACLGTGKIKELGGLRDAFELVRSRANVSEGIIRVIAQEASGRIAVRNGRFIIGAHIGSSGLSGYPALKSFLALKRGMYYYLEGDEAGGITDLEQSLGVDVTPLLFAEDGKDLLSRFSQMAQENGWDCVTEVYLNATPSANMAAFQADQPKFGDNTFLDKIAWAAKSTWQRVTALGKRFDPRYNQDAARVFGDLDNALSKVAGPTHPTSGAPSQDHIRAWQVAQEAMAPAAVATRGIPPAPGAPGSYSGGGPVYVQENVAQPAPTQPPTHVPTAPVALQPNIPTVPMMQQMNQIPPAAIESHPAGFDSTPAAYVAPTPAIENHPPTAQGYGPIEAGTPTNFPQPNISGAPSGANIPVTPSLGQPISDSVPIFQQQPPQQQSVAEQQQQASHELSPAQQEQLRISQDQFAQQKKLLEQQQMRISQELAYAQQQQMRVSQQLREHEQKQQAFQQQQALQQPQHQPQDPAPPSNTASTRASASPPSSDGVQVVSGSQKHRQFAMSPRDTNDRVQAHHDRTVESQNLRLIDIEQAIAESDDDRKKGRISFDPAAIGLALVTVGLIIVGYFAFVTINYMYSGEDYIQRAQDYVKQGKPEMAINEYTMALGKRPGDKRLLSMRAGVYESNNEFDKALKDYETVVAAHPDDVDAALYCAMLHCRLFQFNDALAIATKILETSPQNQNALALNGVALAGDGDYPKALEFLSKVEDDSKLAPYMMACANGARGLSYLHTNQAQKALSYYQIALKNQPKNDSLHRETALCFEQLNDSKNAIAELQTATQLAPANSLNFTELAKLYDRMRDYENAAATYKQAIKQDKHPADLYVKLAEDELYLHRYGDAVEACNDALQFDPMQKRAMLIKDEAVAKEKSGKPIAAGLADLHSDLQPPVAAASAPVTKGYQAFRSGHYVEAVNLFYQAVKEDPSDINAHRLLAHALLLSGNKNAAYDEFVWLASGKNLPTGDTMVYVDLCERTGHSERALTTLSEALELHPTWVDARVRMIRACVGASLRDRAAAVAEEGIARASSAEEKQRYQDALNAPASNK
ncbi:MAG TPA: tetratricopeptide repeat protein [Candidatus Obscuribacterales bacterium]